MASLTQLSRTGSCTVAHCILEKTLTERERERKRERERERYVFPDFANETRLQTIRRRWDKTAVENIYVWTDALKFEANTFVG
jgi:hypothetical protein